MSRSHRKGANHRRSHNMEVESIVSVVALGLLMIFMAGTWLVMTG